MHSGVKSEFVISRFSLLCVFFPAVCSFSLTVTLIVFPQTHACRQLSVRSRRGIDSFSISSVLYCLVFLHLCLSLSVTGLCPPLEKRLLPITAHSSTWLLLHHSSHPPGPDQTAHPLLRRYSERGVCEHAGLSLISRSRLMKRMKENSPLGIALLVFITKEGTLMTLCIS